MSLAHKLLAVRNAAHTIPSPSEQDIVLAMVREGDPYASLFFSEVEDPAWIPSLESNGFFRVIPEPIRHEDGSTSYPRSLALHGLARLAPKAPEAAARILTEIPPSGNLIVGDQMMRCMLAIRDSEQVPRLLPIAEALINAGSRSTRLYFRDLLKSWVEIGRTEEALKLLSTYIESIVRDAPLHQWNQQITWELGQCDRDILAPMITDDPGRVASVCFKGLCGYYDSSRPRSQKPEVEFDEFLSAAMDDPRNLTHWLEDFRQTGLNRDDPGAILAHRLYYALQPIYLNNPKEREKQDNALLEHPWNLFTRLRCQLYADFPEQTLDSARREVFASLDNMNRTDGRHGFEFASMLEKHATCHGRKFLSIDEVGAIVAKVQQGPLDHEGNLDPDPNYQRHFWRQQLWPIRSLLPDEIREQLDKWAETDTGKRKDPVLEDYKPIRMLGRGGFVQDRSPYTMDELADLPEDQLWQVLNTWKKTREWIEDDDFVEESHRELARTFSKLLTIRAERFPASSQWWLNLQRPVMLSVTLEEWAKSLGSGEEKKTEEPTSVDIASSFGVMGHIISASQDSYAKNEASEDSVDNPDWSQARLASAHFLKAFVRSSPAVNDWSAKVENLLIALITGSEDRLDQLEQSKHHDWQFEAINSVRGEAWEALLSLALKERNNPNPGEGSASPWICELLTRRLKPEVSESPAIYSLLGSQLRYVAYALPDWVQDHKYLLFPVDRPECIGAITDGHLAYDQPHRIVVERLPEILHHALDVAERRVKAVEEDGDASDNARDVSSRLGFHIAFYLWNDWFPNPEIGNQLFDRFLSISTSGARAETLGHIGTAFEKAEPEPDVLPLIERAKNLLNRWLEHVKKEAETQPPKSGMLDSELGQFADLIAAECFPFNWRVEVASAALSLITRPRWSFQLLDTLEQWSEEGNASPERIKAGIRLLSALTRELSDELRWSIQVKRLTQILKAGLEHGDPDVRDQTSQVIENLLRHGFFELLDLSSESAE